MTPVYLEVGKQRVFACSLDWPGWCRLGRTEELALDTLAAYAPRYAIVAAEAGVRFPRTHDVEVVERLTGSGQTDFGIPGKVAARDAEPVTAAQARRHAAILRASWAVLDRVAAGAPAVLRKGPRGGGRDRDKIVEHVLDSEAAYLRVLGVKHPQPGIDDRAGIASLRETIVEVLGRPSDGTPIASKRWPARYAVRRIVWHVLDHAWEIEDKSDPVMA